MSDHIHVTSKGRTSKSVSGYSISRLSNQSKESLPNNSLPSAETVFDKNVYRFTFEPLNQSDMVYHPLAVCVLNS